MQYSRGNYKHFNAKANKLTDGKNRLDHHSCEQQYSISKALATTVMSIILIGRIGAADSTGVFVFATEAGREKL